MKYLFQNFSYLLFLSFVLSNCSNNSDLSQNGVVARVGDMQLTIGEIDFPLNISAEDSLLILNQTVNDWVETQLLFEKALINVPDNAGKIEKQIQEYKEEIYIHKYEQLFMNQKLDTLVSNSAIEEFYNAHKDEFILTQAAVKPLFIIFPKNLDLTKAKRWFFSSNAEDQDNLKDYSYQFSPKFYFEDTWLEYKTLIQEIPIDNLDPNIVFSSSGVILQDTVNYYYIRIKQFKEKGKYAPLELVNSDIVKIILHKRRLALIKEMRNKILQEALHKQEFEIFIKNK